METLAGRLDADTEFLAARVQESDRAGRWIGARHTGIVQKHRHHLDLRWHSLSQQNPENERFPPKPGIARQGINPEIAETVSDGPVAVKLDSVELMGMDANNGVGAGIDQVAPDLPLVLLHERLDRRSPGRRNAPMHNHDHMVG